MRSALAPIMVILLVGTGLSACGQAEVTSYDECVAAGHPQLKTYPGQCVLPDGTRFVQPIPDPPAVCKDQCGDGECQEMVCLGSNCPCAESAESCSQDCSTPAR